MSLTPAYDLAPGPRTGDTSRQAMGIDRDHNRQSRLGLCVAASDIYHLDKAAARELIDAMVDTIHDQWGEAAADAELTNAERTRLWRRQILHPSVDYDDWR